ncbi:MAG: DUF2807 domain-containing protein [Bacteroidota bacterium]|nr:DUF2807 domain-containing protein [Bacteroidota bacterium]
MKTSTKLVIYGTLFLCLAIITFIVYSKTQIGNIQGITFHKNSKSISKSDDLTSYHSIKISGNYDIDLIQGPASIKYEGDSMLVENVKVTLNDSVLTISNHKEIHMVSSPSVKLVISFPTLKEFTFLGNGDVNMKDSAVTSEIKIELAGSANIKTKFNSSIMHINILGSGAIENRGQADSLKALISGSGEIDLSETITKYANATILGSGDISIHATEQLDSEINGSGNIYYLGDPKINLNNMGSGSVKPYKK